MRQNSAFSKSRFSLLTVDQFGTYFRGSALWIEDNMKSLYLNCYIYPFDINSERVKLTWDINIKFDNFKINKFIDQEKYLFENMESPILVIEDSHETSNGIIKSINTF